MIIPNNQLRPKHSIKGTVLGGSPAERITQSAGTKTASVTAKPEFMDYRVMKDGAYADYDHRQIQSALNQAVSVEFDTCGYAQRNTVIDFDPHLLPRDANDIDSRGNKHVMAIYDMLTALEIRGVFSTSAWPVRYIEAYLTDVAKQIQKFGYVPGWLNLPIQRYPVGEPELHWVASPDCLFSRYTHAAVLAKAGRIMGRDSFTRYAIRLTENLPSTTNPGWFKAKADRGRGKEYEWRVKDDVWASFYSDAGVYRTWAESELIGPRLDVSAPNWLGREVFPTYCFEWRVMYETDGGLGLRNKYYRQADVLCDEAEADAWNRVTIPGAWGVNNGAVVARNLWICHALAAKWGEPERAARYKKCALWHWDWYLGSNALDTCNFAGGGRRDVGQHQNIGAWETWDGETKFPYQQGITPYGEVDDKTWTKMSGKYGLDPETPQYRREVKSLGGDEIEGEFTFTQQGASYFMALIRMSDLNHTATPREGAMGNRWSVI